MSNTATNKAYKIKAGSARNKAVLVALANHANDDGKCWPYIRTLVAETELCNRAVRAALADLEKRGLISRKAQFLDATQYRRNDLITLHLDGASDAGYAAPDAGYIRHDMPQHAAPHAAQEEPSLNHQREPSKNRTRRALAIVDQSFDEFDNHFWPLYPHKVGRPSARKAYAKARKRAAFNDIMAGLKRYVAAHPADYPYWKGPAAWLNDERWSDEPAAKPSHGPVVDGILRAGEKWLIDLEEARRLKAQGAVS